MPKQIFVASNIYEAFEPIYYAQKLVGLSPQPLKRSDKNIGLLSVIYLILVLILHCICLYGLFTKLEANITDSWIFNNGSMIHVCGVMILSIYTILFNLFIKKTVWEIFESICQIDIKLLKHCESMDYAKTKKIIVMEIIFASVVIFAAIFIGQSVHEFILEINNSFILFMSYLLGYIVVVYFLTQLFNFISLVQNRFVIINKIIDSIIKSREAFFGQILNKQYPKSNKVANTPSAIIGSNPHIVVEELAVIHDGLCDVVDKINYCYSVQMMILVGLNFVEILFAIFSIYRVFLYYTFDGLWTVIIYAIWIVINLFTTIYMITICSSTTRQGITTAVVVHKLMNRTRNSELLIKLQSFSQQLTHNKPIFTCGLFLFDWTLLYSYIGAATTYLVILIQFDISSRSSSQKNNCTTSN